MPTAGAQRDKKTLLVPNIAMITLINVRVVGNLLANTGQMSVDCCTKLPGIARLGASVCSTKCIHRTQRGALNAECVAHSLDHRVDHRVDHHMDHRVIMAGSWLSVILHFNKENKNSQFEFPIAKVLVLSAPGVLSSNSKHWFTTSFLHHYLTSYCHRL